MLTQSSNYANSSIMVLATSTRVPQRTGEIQCLVLNRHNHAETSYRLKFQCQLLDAKEIRTKHLCPLSKLRPPRHVENMSAFLCGIHDFRAAACQLLH